MQLILDGAEIALVDQMAAILQPGREAAVTDPTANRGRAAAKSLGCLGNGLHTFDRTSAGRRGLPELCWIA